MKRLEFGLRRAVAATFMAILLLVQGAAQALNFELGEVEANVNVLLSAGAAWRMENPDGALISKRSQLGQAGLEAGDDVLCADNETGGDPNPAGGGTEDIIGGCVLGAREHHEFVQAPGSFSQEGDNGNLNYERGDLVRATLKSTIDIDAYWDDFGLFARLIALYDPTAEDFKESHIDALHQPLATRRPKAAEDELALSAKLEDFYLYGSFDAPGDRTLSVKLGKQVISWGESLTFVVNSVNSNNPPSVIRLNTPGLDLKELFVPINALSAGIDLTENLAMDMFYQLDWEPVKLAPVGDFYSTSDVAGSQNTYAMITQGRDPEDPGNLQDQYVAGTDEHALAMGRGCINDGTNIGDDVSIYQQQLDKDAFDNPDNPRSLVGDRLAEFGYYQAQRNGEREEGRTFCRARDRTPGSDGQWGLKFAYYAEWLNDTEFGFYYTNTHSRLPIASAIATDINDDAEEHGLHGLFSFAFAFGAHEDGALEEDDADFLGALKRPDSLALFLEYPEDIQMYGISFNTTFGDLSVSGEVAYRPNLPVQISTIDLFLGALAPALNQSRDATGPSYVEAYRYASRLDPADQAEYDALRESGMSNYDAYWALNDNRGPTGIYQSNRNGVTSIGTSMIQASEIISGYERLQVANISTTLLYATSLNPFGADQWTLVGDFGSTQVLNMPELNELQFAAPGDDNWYGPGREQLDSVAVGNGGVPCTEVTNVLTNIIGLDGQATLLDTVISGFQGLANSSDPILATGCVPGVLRQPSSSEPGSTFATASSWGFRVLSFLKYNNLILGANLNQLFGLYVDVNGNSPNPGGNFVEGRKRFVWGSEFTRGDWTLNFIYNWYTGAGDRNLEGDRDTFAFDVRYTF